MTGNNSGEATPEVRNQPPDPETLDAYFRSIEDPFRETRTESEEGSFLKTSAVVLFVFSLIPVFPFLLSVAIPRLFGPKLISFWGLSFSLGSFWFWWVSAFGSSLLLMLCALKFLGPSKEQKEKWLSPQQMRFAYCYGIVSEIRNYKTNHLSRHIKLATDYLEKVSAQVSGPRVIHMDEFVYTARNEIYVRISRRAQCV